jgi:hypothetical protein
MQAEVRRKGPTKARCYLLLELLLRGHSHVTCVCPQPLVIPLGLHEHPLREVRVGPTTWSECELCDLPVTNHNATNFVQCIQPGCKFSVCETCIRAVVICHDDHKHPMILQSVHDMSNHSCDNRYCRLPVSLYGAYALRCALRCDFDLCGRCMPLHVRTISHLLL